MYCAIKKDAQSYNGAKTLTHSRIMHVFPNIKPLGVPFNCVNAAMLTHIIAEQSGFEPGELIWFGGDVHLYSNHMEQAKEQLSRVPKALPQLNIKRKAPSIFDYAIDDFELIGYEPHPPISAPVAV